MCLSLRQRLFLSNFTLVANGLDLFSSRLLSCAFDRALAGFNQSIKTELIRFVQQYSCLQAYVCIAPLVQNMPLECMYLKYFFVICKLSLSILRLLPVQLLRLGRARLPTGAGPGELRVRSHSHDARPSRDPRQLLPLLRLHGGAAFHVLPRSEAHGCVKTLSILVFGFSFAAGRGAAACLALAPLAIYWCRNRGYAMLARKKKELFFLRGDVSPCPITYWVPLPPSPSCLCLAGYPPPPPLSRCYPIPSQVRSPSIRSCAAASWRSSSSSGWRRDRGGQNRHQPPEAAPTAKPPKAGPGQQRKEEKPAHRMVKILTRAQRKAAPAAAAVEEEKNQ